MFEKIEELFKKKNILKHKNQGITVAKVSNFSEGVDLAAEILYQIIDKKTVLYLSGGSTPKSLYTKLAREEKLAPGAVGQVDERYGEPYHASSNQLMIRDTGLTRYLEIRDIPFYPILTGKERIGTAESYDQKIRELNAVFPKSIAVLGIGIDGHIAGIAPNRKDLPGRQTGFKNPLFETSQKHLLVSTFDDPKGMFKERVTMTFLALEMQDVLINLVFGDDKKEALEQLFDEGSEHEIPARFYKRSEIAKKTLLITDQSV